MYVYIILSTIIYKHYCYIYTILLLLITTIIIDNLYMASEFSEDSYHSG